MSLRYFGYNKGKRIVSGECRQEVMGMAGIILLCKILVLAAGCIGTVWFGYWYKEHVE